MQTSKAHTFDPHTVSHPFDTHSCGSLILLLSASCALCCIFSESRTA